MNKKLTYISLFSSAGVGCYGFKLEDYECIATNELIPRRLEIQKFNNKCKYDSGYICGDITESKTKELLLEEIKKWEKADSLKKVDVIIATPPCQGMSVANHKKTANEIVRNSLVVESIKIIKEIQPNIFIFENVPAFMKTICTDVDGEEKAIAEAIENNLGSEYSFYSKVINFKNYGACSSRQRNIVIGVLKKLSDDISPFELFPDYMEEKTLKSVIGNLKSLSIMGEVDDYDIYHAFRRYPEHMREWISCLKEGESAFDNSDVYKKPHQIINGEIVVNKQKNGDKYKRQYWNKVGPCIHTRNDQLASQNTIHPTDDRVFSIRELMEMMTIPQDFKWVEENIESLNNLSHKEKTIFLKKQEIKIRQSIGEAVPTQVFKSVANKIKKALSYNFITTSEINKLVAENDFFNTDNLIHFIEENPLNLSISTLGRIAELSNTSRTDNAAFFTNKSLITEMIKQVPDFEKDEIRILEPSVGVGNFIPLLFKKFEGKKVKLDLLDIDEKSLSIIKVLLSKMGISKYFELNYINNDFLLEEFDFKYDLVIGNPPFYKIKNNPKLISMYKKNAINKNTTNICSYFLDKAIQNSSYVALVFPKFLLNTPEFSDSRKYLSKMSVECILDFGEKGFQGVLVETIAILVNTDAKPKNTKIISYTNGFELNQKQAYIFDTNFPYWLIYRNAFFDSVSEKLDFDKFKVFRDRQITNSVLQNNGDIRVLKSRNLDDSGENILDIASYDSYISIDDAKKLSVFSFLNNENVYLTPNMTYKPRVMKKQPKTLVNGSMAILIPKTEFELNDIQLKYFSSDEYREFYKIARNYQTRSLNVDSCSVFFYGILKG